MAYPQQKMQKQMELISRFKAWVQTQPHILGAALVGSYARGTARKDSDVDFVIVTDQPKSFENDEWLQHFGDVSKITLEDYGLVQSRRVFYGNGVEVEFGITTPAWLNTKPIDAGTKEVLDAGYKLIDDKVGLFSMFFASVGLRTSTKPDELECRIRAEFPSLKFSEARLVTSGVDHVVLILDSEWVFRFPRTDEYRKSFKRELRLLHVLRDVSPVSVPEYQYFSRNEDLGIESFLAKSCELKDSNLYREEFRSESHPISLSSCPLFTHYQKIDCCQPRTVCFGTVIVGDGIAIATSKYVESGSR